MDAVQPSSKGHSPVSSVVQKAGTAFICFFWGYAGMACKAFVGSSAASRVAHCISCVLERHCRGCGRRLRWGLQEGAWSSGCWPGRWSRQELGRTGRPRPGSWRRLLSGLGRAGSSGLGLSGICHYYAGRWLRCRRMSCKRLVEHMRDVICAIWTWRGNGHWCG